MTIWQSRLTIKPRFKFLSKKVGVHAFKLSPCFQNYIKCSRLSDPMTRAFQNSRRQLQHCHLLDDLDTGRTIWQSESRLLDYVSFVFKSFLESQKFEKSKKLRKLVWQNLHILRDECYSKRLNKKRKSKKKRSSSIKNKSYNSNPVSVMYWDKRRW